MTALKTRSADLICRARDCGQPVIIAQNGKATAVLQDFESYQRERQVLLLLKYLARRDQDYRESRVLSDEEADGRFCAMLAAMKSGAGNV